MHSAKWWSSEITERKCKRWKKRVAELIINILLGYVCNFKLTKIYIICIKFYTVYKNDIFTIIMWLFSSILKPKRFHTITDNLCTLNRDLQSITPDVTRLPLRWNWKRQSTMWHMSISVIEPCSHHVAIYFSSYLVMESIPSLRFNSLRVIT